MIESSMDPRLAANVIQTNEMDRFKSQMEGLKRSLSDKRPDKMTRLKQACQNFEAVFIGKLWDQMRQTVPKEGYLHSKQEDSYMGMFNRDFSEKMAQSGGIGLADMIYDQLSRKLKEASQETLTGGVDIRPVEDAGIPLKRGAEPIALNRSRGMTLEDWGGSAVLDSPGSAAAAAAGERGGSEEHGVLSDVEVKARLESLTRRLEARRIRDGLAGTARPDGKRSGYAAETDGDGAVGRKLAKIG